MAGPVQSTTDAKPIATMTAKEVADAYWKENVRLIAILLSIWALVSYVCAYLLAQPLADVMIGSLPFGFWFGQQGSIITFMILILVYAVLMDGIDKKYGVNE
jgi:putative solute:sodium symporter small subunit